MSFDPIPGFKRGTYYALMEDLDKTKKTCTKLKIALTETALIEEEV